MHKEDFPLFLFLYSIIKLINMDIPHNFRTISMSTSFCVFFSAFFYFILQVD